MRTATVVGLLVVSLLAVSAPAAGQSADVTLTVAVETGNGTAVGGATIEASWDGGNTTVRTASNGRAFVDVPEGADVSLAVESDEYIRNRPVVVRNASERDVTAVVRPKGRLTVAVNDTSGPVAEARVSLRRDGESVVSGTTDADGTFTTPAVEQGDYYLELAKAGYYRNLTLETVGEDTRLNASMRRGTTNVAFRVVDDHFSPPEPLSEVRIEVGDIGSQRLTDGSVTFTLPVNTRYEVTATKDGYETTTTTVDVGTSAAERTLTLNRERALNLTASNERVVVGESLEVTVRNAYGEPVEGATVTVGDASATTGASGTARVTVPAAGEQTVVATLDGVTSNELTVEGVATATAEPDPTPTATATATATEAATATDTPTATSAPGFGVFAVVAALLAVALLARRR